MKKKCALYASKLVKDGMVVGLGGGSTIQYLIDYVKDKSIPVSIDKRQISFYERVSYCDNSKDEIYLSI